MKIWLWFTHILHFLNALPQAFHHKLMCAIVKVAQTENWKVSSFDSGHGQGVCFWVKRGESSTWKLLKLFMFPCVSPLIIPFSSMWKLLSYIWCLFRFPWKANCRNIHFPTWIYVINFVASQNGEAPSCWMSGIKLIISITAVNMGQALEVLFFFFTSSHSANQMRIINHGKYIKKYVEIFFATYNEWGNPQRIFYCVYTCTS